MLNGDDFGTIGESGEIQTAGNRQPVDQDRAAAAQSLPAALARAKQPKFLLEDFDKILVRADVGRNLAAVEFESDGFTGVFHLNHLPAADQPRCGAPDRPPRV